MQLVKSLVLNAAAAAAMLAASSMAVAAPVVDQSNDTIGFAALTGGRASVTWQQGVTAGMSGLLTAVALNFQDSLQLGVGTTVFVNLGSAWQVDQNEITLNTGALQAGWNIFDVSAAGIILNAGDQFVIGVTGVNMDEFDPTLTGTQRDQYSDGSLYLNGSPYVQSDWDMNFRTYVDAGGQQLPEPTSVALAGLALVGAGLARRRAKKA